ncbi:hypothetical protein AVEN_82262-1 [Araneus ventricosus]|uniref:Uncharacterized protein n=1 Tax=Araneus ventricosus TaxID=182803 RepID=A0A4Y2HDQ8_ARAVE|nr:hypothetical protein AVEN_82262-1 [Araneus ventricosus]
MATDFKLEIFAYDIFQTAFMSHRLIKYKPSVFELYGDECFGAPSYAEVYDDLFHKAIFCRRELFQIVYKGELMYEKIESCKSPSDLFDYLINRCDQNYLFHNLNVFERMFATCAFVVSMCVHIYWYNIVDVISYGHLFWAIFYYQYTEEFYKEGGWNELKRVANTYDLLYEFLALFPENFDNYFSAIKEATVNYRHFKKVVFSKEQHVSKMWVRFRIENFENYVRIPVSYEISLNPIKIEFLLEELKQFCDPRSKEALQYTEQFRDSGSNLNFLNGFVSTTDDSDSDDISPERYQVKRVNEFVSKTDNSCNSVDDSDSENISGESSRVKRFNEFVLDTDDSSSSMDDSDSDDMPQERYQRRDFSAGMASEIFEAYAEIKTGDNDPSIRPLLLAHQNRIVDSFSGKLSNSSIECDKKLQRKHSGLNFEADVFDHLYKNEILKYEEKTFNEKALSTNTSELGLNAYSVNKHNIFAVEAMSQPFEQITEKSPNTEGLDFGHSIANYDRNPDNENETGITNNFNPRNATRHKEIANLVEDAYIVANQMDKSVWEAKSPQKNLRTQKELNFVNIHINIDGERKNTEENGNSYSDSKKREINKTAKSMNVLFTNLKTTSEWNAETSPDVAHNWKDFDLVNGYVSSDDEKENIKKISEFFDSRKREMAETINSMVASELHGKTSPNIAHNSKDSNHLNATVRSEDERKIIQEKVDALKKELDDPMFNQFSRTFLKSEDMEAIGYVRATLFTKEEMLEYSPESLKNSKKRTGNEQETSRKRFSPERKEIENEMFA